VSLYLMFIYRAISARETMHNIFQKHKLYNLIWVFTLNPPPSLHPCLCLQRACHAHLKICSKWPQLCHSHGAEKTSPCNTKQHYSTDQGLDTYYQLAYSNHKMQLKRTSTDSSEWVMHSKLAAKELCIKLLILFSR